MNLLCLVEGNMLQARRKFIDIVLKYRIKLFRERIHYFVTHLVNKIHYGFFYKDMNDAMFFYGPKIAGAKDILAP